MAQLKIEKLQEILAKNGMIQSGGTDQFEGNYFSYWDWSAPIMQTPEAVIYKLRELKLEGRIVKDIIAVGMGYNWNDYSIEDAIYRAMENMRPEQKATIPNPDAFLPIGVEVSCFAELDEPLLIIFEDGEVLAISFDEGSCVRMGMNNIPLTIEPGTNSKNFHANRLFEDMIGKRIVEVDVTSSTVSQGFTGSQGLRLGEQLSYISRVDIVYDDETINHPYCRLSFSPFYDFGCVSLIDYGGQIHTVSTAEIPRIVEGYVNPELFE